MTKEITEAIQNSEMVLVGIGEEFSPKLPENLKNTEDPEWFFPYAKSRFYEELPADHEVIRAYDHLRECIGERPYFVVTLNTDDLIYRSAFDAEQIVAPCGSMGKLQCKEHIVEAREIRGQVLENYQKGLAQDLPVCPTCGEPLAFHTIENEDYLESGYLPQWERYKKWLSCTLNKKLCVLELGVGFSFPQVIRWPFEKTAFFNQKAVFVRVNSKFPQIEAELAGKAVSVAQSPVTLLNS